MDVSAIIAKSRVQTSTSIGQKTDTLMLADLNAVYKDIFSRLATKSKKYAWDLFTTDLVAGQNEYILPQWSPTDVWIKRVLKVEVLNKDWFENYPIFDTSFRIDQDWDSKPYCINRDWSIFLYPTPKEDVVWGLKIQWQYMPIDLLLTSTSSDIKLPAEYHKILILWLNAYCFGDKQMVEKKIEADNTYETALMRMIEEWWADIEEWYETTIEMIDCVSQKFLP